MDFSHEIFTGYFCMGKQADWSRECCELGKRVRLLDAIGCLINWCRVWISCTILIDTRQLPAGRTGDYQVSILFNDQSIPDSPFNVYVAPSAADATTLDVTDLENQLCQVSTSATPNNHRILVSYYCTSDMVMSVLAYIKPNTHRRRRRDSTVELSRVSSVNAPVGSRDPVYIFLCCWTIYKWRHNDVIVEKVIDIDQNSHSQTAMSLFGQFPNCRPNPSAVVVS